MRWALAGCKPQAVGVLDALAAQGFVPQFLAMPPGLGEADQAPLRERAARFGVALLETKNLTEHRARLTALDLLLVCRFNLLPEAAFAAPRLGSVNIHSSLLPRYRGVHPVSWVLVNGEAETGVTIHRLDAGIDTGAILRQRALAIAPRHDIWSLTEDLNRLSAELAADLFAEVAAAGALPSGRPQAGAGSYARRRTPEDGRIDWNRPQRDIVNLCRALRPPLPPAFCLGSGGEPVAIIDSCHGDAASAPPGRVLAELEPGWYRIGCGDGTLFAHADRPLAAGLVLQ